MREFNAKAYLQSLSQLDDENICPATAALALASRGSNTLDFYLAHLDELVTQTQQQFDRLATDSRRPTVAAQHEALTTTLFQRFCYQGDRRDYDNLKNADLAAVIDRRRGIPIALAMLCVYIGRQLSWQVEGVNMPRHFLCRIQAEGQALLFDPFSAGQIMEPPALRALLKQLLGPDAELAPQHYQGVSNRALLLRLQNNIKLRQLQQQDWAAVIDTLKAMLLVDAEEPGLYFELGQVYAKTGQTASAIDVLEKYLQFDAQITEQAAARALLKKLHGKPH